MKPSKIFLVRHGQSEGNVDKNAYTNTPDYAIQLTPWGKKQARQAGEIIRKIVPSDIPLRFYTSPFWRARQTYLGIESVLSNPKTLYEDPRLREQEWGHLLSSIEERERIIKVRDAYGSFYYRFKEGESCADVYDRVSSFLDTFWREFDKMDSEWNAIIVSHGMTIRTFLMRWLHMTVEQFEELSNPKNGQVIMLRLGEDGKYHLEGELRRKQPTHQYQFDWNVHKISY